MHYVAVKMLGDRNEVSDIVQEVFISFFERLQSGNEIRNPKGWLYRTTCNKCIDFFRKQKQFGNTESLKDFKSEDDPSEKQEDTSTINLALSRLKPEEKMLAVLYSEGLSYKELSETLGIKFSSVGKMLSRTLKKLEKELKNQKYELY